MLLKQWEKYKASPTQRVSYGPTNLPEEFQDKWKGGPYKKQWGRGRGGKKNDQKFPSIPKPKMGAGRGRGRGQTKGKGKSKPKGFGVKGNAAAGSVTIMDINPINLDADYVTYVPPILFLFDS